MTIEIALLISIVSVTIGVLSFITNAKKNHKTDTSEMTTVIVKLENIGDNVSEIKTDVKGVKEDVNVLRERVAKAEASAKQAHKRLDDYIELDNRK